MSNFCGGPTAPVRSAPIGAVALAAALACVPVFGPGAMAQSTDMSGVEALARVCAAAAHEAAGRGQIAPALLQAGFLSPDDPWPWSVAIAGDVQRYASMEDARDVAAAALEQGAGEIRIGCFGLDPMVQGAGFTSLDEMFWPLPNALMAAELFHQMLAPEARLRHPEDAGAEFSARALLAEAPDPAHLARFAQWRGLYSGAQAAPPSLADLQTPTEDATGFSEIPEIPEIRIGDGGRIEAVPAVRANTYPLMQQGAPGERSASAGSLFVRLAPQTMPVDGTPE